MRMSSSALFYLPEVLTIANAVHQINEEILDKEVRLIGDQGEQLGIMSAQEALKIAAEREMDLVKIAPGSNPPVCKVMDYGKFRFEQTKKEKEAKKNQQEKSGVTISTLHSVKGLEYDCVYILDVNEGVMPYQKAVLEEDIEEERRMFYVGMTRARKKLTLCSVKERFDKKTEPSRFLEEILM